MTEPQDRQAIALFRYGLIADLIHLSAGSRGLYARLREKFYVPLSTGNVMDMYKAIAWQLGLPVERNRASAYRAIHSEVCRLAVECRIHPVLVVDEAQHLRNDVLEDLRLLTNYAMDSEPRLCLLLVGLTELRRRLSMAVHESLAQRIVVRYHLGGLARDELPEYLDHRLRLAGTSLPLFEPSAVQALYQATHGLPRKVNLVAHYALATPSTSSRSATAHAIHATVRRRALLTTLVPFCATARYPGPSSLGVSLCLTLPLRSPGGKCGRSLASHHKTA